MCPETVAYVLLIAFGARIIDIINQSQNSSSLSPDRNSDAISPYMGDLCAVSLVVGQRPRAAT